MLRKVNVTLFEQFLRLLLSIQAYNSNVNVTLVRQFLSFYCLSKLIACLNHDVCFISLLFSIVSSLNHIY